MTDEQTQTAGPRIPDLPPLELAHGVFVLRDERISLVPNVGIVLGERAALVVDTGMGVANGKHVLAQARALTDLPLLLTLTHFHPEHGYGAQVFAGEATIVYNDAQREEHAEKFQEFIEMFSGFDPVIAAMLADVELVLPHVAYDGRAELDLGGRSVELREVGPAHTRGDQIVLLPEERVLFTGDLVDNRFIPILPDADAHGSLWIDVLERLDGLDAAVVVPGHGAVGDTTLIRDMRAFLEDVRARVAALAREGVALDEIERRLEPALAADYPDWENGDPWIRFAIQNFHGELDGGR